MANRPRNTSGQKKPTTPTPVTAEVEEKTSSVNEEQTLPKDHVTEQVDEISGNGEQPNGEDVTIEAPKTVDPVARLHTPVQEVAEFDLSQKKVEEVVVAPNLTIQTTSPELATKIEKNPTVEGFLLRKYGLDEENYSTRLKQTLTGMVTYVATMNIAAPVDSDKGKKYQHRLLQTIRGALDTDDFSDASICFDALLFIVARNLDTTFNERLVCRFIHQLPERDQIIFSNILNIIINTANPRQRATGLKTIDLKLALNRVGGGRIATNMLNFYSGNMK